MDDCVTEFVEAMWRRHGCGFAPTGDPCKYQRLAMKCAHDHVIDYLRKLKRERDQQCAWPESQLEDGSFVPWDCSDSSPLPEEIAFQDEFRRLIELACEGLTPHQRELFYRHDIEGERIGDIAVSLNISEKAADQALRRARRRIQSNLKKQGISEEDLRGLLATPPS